MRTVIKDGQPWFVAADICAVLEHTDTSKAVSRLDADEKGTSTVRTLGGEQEVNVISESGLYALILTSRKPHAKAFRRWVTGEVLPSIRRTGSYNASSPPGLLDGGRVLHIDLPRPGRFVVTAIPGQAIHVRQTGLATVIPERTALRCQVMAYALMTTRAFWEMVQQMQAVGFDPSGGFALEKLEHAILEGGDLARQYLDGHLSPATSRLKRSGGHGPH